MPRKRDAFDPIAIALAEQEQVLEAQNLFIPVFAEARFQLDWLVQDFLPLGALVLLAGSPKSGKSCLATALAIAVANGLPFAGRQTRAGTVLWIAAEESHQERHYLYNMSPLVESSTPIYTCYDPLHIDEDRSLAALDHWVRETEAKLIVVDPLLGAITGRSLQDSWAARRCLQTFKRFCASRRVCGLVLHHPKRDYIRGGVSVADNAQLAATASMNIVMAHRTDFANEERGPEAERGLQSASGVVALAATQPNPSTQRRTRDYEATSRIVRLDCEGRGPFANRTLFLRSRGPLDYRPMIEPGTWQAEEKPLTPSETRVLETLATGPKSSEAIIDISKIHEGTARNVITNLRRRGLIVVDQVQNGVRLYALTPENPEME